jgi:hypothetical protein
MYRDAFRLRTRLPSTDVRTFGNIATFFLPAMMCDSEVESTGYGEISARKHFHADASPMQVQK